jgi:hypothetical protein
MTTKKAEKPRKKAESYRPVAKGIRTPAKVTITGPRLKRDNYGTKLVVRTNVTITDGEAMLAAGCYNIHLTKPAIANLRKMLDKVDEVLDYKVETVVKDKKGKVVRL